MGANKLSWGLFRFRGRNWWRNLKDIPIFIQRIFFTLKHGYSPVANWETFQWFIDVMREILTNYRHFRSGSPAMSGVYDVDKYNVDENSAAYDKILDKMILLLDEMDESDSIYDDMNWKEAYEKRETAKNEFFKLFNEYFYALWD